MEDFVCVLSIQGSLVTYSITRKSNGTYKAILKTPDVENKAIPASLILEKRPNGWQATPWQDEIVMGLAQCIEAA